MGRHAARDRRRQSRARARHRRGFTRSRTLNNFILPSGSLPGAYLHLARTIARRAERLLVTLREGDDGVSEETLRFLNRLSDALFVWARWINRELGEPESRWNAQSSPPQ